MLLLCLGCVRSILVFMLQSPKQSVSLREQLQSSKLSNECKRDLAHPQEIVHAFSRLFSHNRQLPNTTSPPNRRSCAHAPEQQPTPPSLKQQPHHQAAQKPTHIHRATSGASTSASVSASAITINRRYSNHSLHWIQQTITSYEYLPIAFAQYHIWFCLLCSLNRGGDASCPSFTVLPPPSQKGQALTNKTLGRGGEGGDRGPTTSPTRN